jgi:ornithine--oxo-acid transaminase
MEALQVVIDERLSENAARLGVIFRERMNDMLKKTSLITEVRGKGLLNAVVVNDSPESSTAWDLCMSLMNEGLLAKPTHGNIIRLAPPLVLTEEQLHDCCDIIERVFLSFGKKA